MVGRTRPRIWFRSPRFLTLLLVAVVALLVPLTIYGVTTATGNSDDSQDVVASRPGPLALQPDASPEQQLADRYAPVVYLRQVNNNICNTENEGFDPIPVDFVLERPEIPFIVSDNGRPNGRWRTVAESPLAADLFGNGPGFFLDYPGSPVSPGCTYRRYYANRLATEDVPHVAYAHIYLEPDTDELTLQYWMFYYFNDWNNDHEGDWEMIMLFFDANSVEEALAQEPSRVIYAQHGGGERADWDADKLSKEDGHPVVYVARGAHASFYEQHVYLGLAENGTGFGCETTKGPHRRYELNAVVVPHEPAGQDDPHAWLGYTGRWGEFRRSEWNGPTGPNDKTSWTEPVSWADRQRDSSLIVPEFEGFGESPINLFCGIVSAGSRVLTAFTQAPAVGTGIFGAVVIAISWIVSYASRTIRGAFGYYRRNLRTFAIIGAALIPAGYVVATIQTLIFHVPPVEPFITMMQRFPGIRIFLALAIGSVQAALAVIFVSPAVIWAMSQIHAGRKPRIIDAYREGTRAIWPVFVSRLQVAVRVLRSAITIIGIPRALLQVVQAFFIPQAVIHERDDEQTAIQDSAIAADVNIRRTLLTQLVLTVITLLTGPLIAIFLLLAIPSRPLGLVNYVSSVLYALIFPLGAIGMTLLYFEQRQLAENRTTDLHD